MYRANEKLEHTTVATEDTKCLLVFTKILKDIFSLAFSFMHLPWSVIWIQDSVPRVQGLTLLDRSPKIILVLLFGLFYRFLLLRLTDLLMLVVHVGCSVLGLQ